MATTKHRPNWLAEQMHTRAQFYDALIHDLDYKREKSYNDLRAVCAYLHRKMDLILSTAESINIQTAGPSSVVRELICHLNKEWIKFTVSSAFLLDVLGRYLLLETSYMADDIWAKTGRCPREAQIEKNYDGTYFEYCNHFGPPITLKIEERVFELFKIPWPPNK